jgi:hypothetical protein
VTTDEGSTNQGDDPIVVDQATYWRLFDKARSRLGDPDATEASKERAREILRMLGEDVERIETEARPRRFMEVRDPVKRKEFIEGSWEDLRAPDSTPFSRGLARERLRMLGVDPDAEEGDAGGGQEG